MVKNNNPSKKKTDVADRRSVTVREKWKTLSIRKMITSQY